MQKNQYTAVNCSLGCDMAHYFRVGIGITITFLILLTLISSVQAADLTIDGTTQTLYGTYSYGNVSIVNGGILYITAYNGTAGTGTLTFNITNNLTIDSTSSINGSNRGYTGGTYGACGLFTGYGGVGGMFSGYGGGSNGSQTTEGGGGAGAGGYASSGGVGGNGGGGGSNGGAGGSSNGTSSGWDINMGNGAGGGGGSSVSSNCALAANSGAGYAGNPGGARITINSYRVNISGSVLMVGGTGGNGGASYYQGSWYGNGGGGGGGASGGGILINATYVNISYATISTAGGSGGSGGGGEVSGTTGGTGSGGRLKVFYVGTLSNTSTTVTSGSAYYAATNTAPTVPTITNPTNNSVDYSDTSINMTWSTSTDADADTIYYNYQISNDSAFTDLLFNNYTTVTYSGSKTIYANQQHFFRVRTNDTYKSSSWSSTVSIRDLALSTPANNSISYFNYPPMTTSFSFVWSATASSTVNYNLLIARDANFNLIVSDTTFSGTTKTISMDEGTYWYKVRAYYTATGAYGTYTTPWTFTLVGNVSVPSGTGIHGIVYELVNNVITPVSGATVYIQNNLTTWSSSQVTGTNGYYQFSGLTNSTTYYLYVTKQDYQQSPAEYVTTGLYNFTSKNIQIRQTEPTDFESDKQYVKFRARWLWCFSNCDVTGATISAYKSGDVVDYASGVTDSTGSISFRLYKTQLYRVTIVNATAGISQEMTLYPKDTEYLFLVTNTETTMQTHAIQEKDAITINVTKATSSATNATITINYTDSVSGTTALVYYIKQGNTTLQSWHWESGSYNHTFTITGYSGQSYVVNAVATHSTYGTIDRSFAVPFEKSSVGISGIPEQLWLWFAIAIMFFTGAIFTSSTAEKGLLIVCAEGWIFFFMGMFSPLGTAQFAIGLTLASVIAVFAYIKRSQAAEGFS